LTARVKARRSRRRRVNPSLGVNLNKRDGEGGGERGYLYGLVRFEVEAIEATIYRRGV